MWEKEDMMEGTEGGEGEAMDHGRASQRALDTMLRRRILHKTSLFAL